MKKQTNKSEKIFTEFYRINDGYGVVGVGFKCIHCNKDNNFIDIQAETICRYCNKINYFTKETTTEVTYW